MGRKGSSLSVFSATAAALNSTLPPIILGSLTSQMFPRRGCLARGSPSTEFLGCAAISVPVGPFFFASLQRCSSSPPYFLHADLPRSAFRFLAFTTPLLNALAINLSIEYASSTSKIALQRAPNTIPIVARAKQAQSTDSDCAPTP